MVKIDLIHLGKSEWEEELSTAVMRQFGRDWTVFVEFTERRWASGSPALCFSLGEANRQNVKFAKMALSRSISLALSHLQEIF